MLNFIFWVQNFFNLTWVFGYELDNWDTWKVFPVHVIHLWVYRSLVQERQDPLFGLECHGKESHFCLPVALLLVWHLLLLWHLCQVHLELHCWQVITVHTSKVCIKILEDFVLYLFTVYIFNFRIYIVLPWLFFHSIIAKI